MFQQWQTVTNRLCLTIIFLLLSFNTQFSQLIAYPTGSPTLVPTIQPTPAPTIITQNPSLRPTWRTWAPTFSPSVHPTNSPTYTPTNAPSFSPSHAPTRVPTVSKAYDSYFIITYFIKSLENDYLEILLRYPIDMSNDITEIIEQSYLEVTGLEYEYFWLEIDDMLGYKINDITENDYPHFLISKHELTLGSKLTCDEDNCKSLQLQNLNEDNDNARAEFESTVETKLREYFRNYWTGVNAPGPLEGEESYLIFEIKSYSNIKVLRPPGPTIFDEIAAFFVDNYVMTLLLLVIIFMFVISTFALCDMKGICFLCDCCMTMDDTMWNAFTIYGLQIIVFASDINICLHLVFYEDFNNDKRIKYTAISCMVFLVVPYAINLFFGGAITSMHLIAKDNYNAIDFFKKRRCMVLMLTIISGGCYPVIFLLSSGMFGAKLFCSGLTNYELKKLNKIKIIGTICLQNVPQICIQCVYASILHTVTPYIVFAMIVSILSIICTPFQVKKQYGNKKRISYYIEIKIMSENEDEADVEAEGAKFNLHKNKINKASMIFCRALECEREDIEISRNSKVFFSLNFSKRRQKMINGSGVMYYITQFIDKDINIRQVVNLLQESEHYLENEFKRHFDLVGPYACMIKFKSASGMFQVEIDGCKDKQTNFNELLNEMMNDKGLDYNNNEDRENFLNFLYGNDETTNNTNYGEQNEGNQYESIELEAKNRNNSNEKQMYDSLILNQEKASNQDSNSDT